MKKSKLLGFASLVIAIAYVAVPYDMDVAWYGYIDDFFVFIAGYTFFMASCTDSRAARQMLMLVSGIMFIIGMLALISLLLFV